MNTLTLLARNRPPGQTALIASFGGSKSVSMRRTKPIRIGRFSSRRKSAPEVTQSKSTISVDYRVDWR